MQLVTAAGQAHEYAQEIIPGVAFTVALVERLKTRTWKRPTDSSAALNEKPRDGSQSLCSAR